MATSQISGVLHHLCRVLQDGAGLTDGQLLEHHISRRDEAAFAALVRRHGPMVWGVCHRVLRNHHAAEDAFQATFLVLVRRAASIASRELLANWLYGVAHQTALKARATAIKRQQRETQVTEMPEPAVTQHDRWHDLQPVLDEELSRLPDKYRGVIVLCDLEGKTRKEVARQLGCPEGTVASRLVRARTMLAKRLTQRGVVLSGGALAAVLSDRAVSAGVPNPVVESTIKAASLFAAGKAAATGAISVKVTALTEGVVKAMLFNKLKAAIAVVLILGLVVTVATVLTCRTAAGQDDQKPTAEKPVEPAQKRKQVKEDFTTWGQAVGGLQAGLGFRPGEHRAYHHGETVKLVVRVRNVGKEVVKFQYLHQFLKETPPTVMDGKGKLVPQPRYEAGERLHIPVEVNLAPGKEIELNELERELVPTSESGNDRFYSLYGTGKVSVQYERVLGNSSSGTITLDPALGKLATGKLELEIKSEPPPAAWGKEVGGLQAGLGYLPGERRAYHHGETVKLVVWIRNVSKEEVKFQYLYPTIEHSPTVIDGDGKPVPQRNAEKTPGERLPLEVKLAPGRAIVLHELKRELRPAIESGNKKDSTLYGTGKVSVQYEQVLGMPSRGVPGWKLDPARSRLATGKLELEVKDAEKPQQTGLPKPMVEKKKVYTPEEAMLATDEAIRMSKYDFKSFVLTVEFKVQAVTKPTEIKLTPEKDSPWVIGHSPDDLSLHPQPPKRFDEKQFTAILTPKVVKQLNAVGIHLKG
jgi:RNA polymerase sigma factor (sigma-70 family)